MIKAAAQRQNKKPSYSRDDIIKDIGEMIQSKI